MGKLDGQVAIVTGAGRGIGRAIAERCAAEGAKVALVARTESQLRDVAQTIEQNGGTALALPTDVTDADQIEAMVRRVESTFGPVDLLVNNAGMFYAIGPIWEVDPGQWWQDVTVNLLGVFLPCRAVIRSMMSRGRGRILNMIGGGTGNPFAYGSGYASSKAGMMRLTECLAAEVKDTGVKVFAIGPGFVRTEMTEYQADSEAGKKWLPTMGEQIAKGNYSPPTDAAELVAQLGSGRFDALHGRLINAAEDFDQLEAQIPQILASDQRTLRFR